MGTLYEDVVTMPYNGYEDGRSVNLGGSAVSVHGFVAGRGAGLDACVMMICDVFLTLAQYEARYRTALGIYCKL